MILVPDDFTAAGEELGFGQQALIILIAKAFTIDDPATWRPFAIERNGVRHFVPSRFTGSLADGTRTVAWSPTEIIFRDADGVAKENEPENPMF